MAKQLTHGGLFEGIGGFALGAQRAGIKSIYAVEMDNYKKNLLLQHFPKIKLYGKIQKVNPKELQKVDILTGGFPCQDISTSGHQKGITGDRSSMWLYFVPIIQETRPKWIIIENSPNLLNKGLEFILHDLSHCGYNAEWQIISCGQYGLPHIRKRLFIIAYPAEIRCNKRHINFFREYRKIFQQRKVSGQIALPHLVKRFNRHTIYTGARINDGFSVGLDKNQVAAIGDSVSPAITETLFNTIKFFHAKVQY